MAGNSSTSATTSSADGAAANTPVSVSAPASNLDSPNASARMMDDVDELDEGSPHPVASWSSTNAVAGPGPSSSANAARASSAVASSASPAPSQGGGQKRKPRVSIPRPSASSAYHPPPLPHYIINRVPAGHNTRNNPHVIQFTDDVTDGSESRWPSEAERKPDHEVNGKTNWYEVQDKNVGKHQNLRLELGKRMAKRLGLGMATKGGKDEYWALELPKNYLYTVHHSVTGSGDPRTDAYVFGSAATLKFRTANELDPHLTWLIDHGPDDNLTCPCKYCGKKTQGAVNQDLGLSERGSSVAPSPTAGGTPKPKLKREAGSAGVSAGAGSAAGRLAQPASFTAPGGENLLGAGQNKGKKKRSATEASGPGGKKQRISASSSALTSNGAQRSPSPSAAGSPTYEGAYTNRQRDEDLADLSTHRLDDLVWAAIPSPLVPSPSAIADNRDLAGAVITHWPAIVVARNLRAVGKVLVPPVPGSSTPPQLETTQEWRYDVRLLAVQDELFGLKQDEVRTWLAHPPSTEFWSPDMMREERAARHVWDPETKLTRRDCELRKEIKNLEEAITALALALQIAAHIVGQFTLCDRFKINPSHIVSSPNLSEDEKTRRENLIRTWAFQSVHWGAERIWVGDLARLMHDEKSPFLAHLAHKPSDGSKDRALFLKVTSIYKDATTGRAKICGDVWELKELDDVAGASNGTVTTEAKGKEKERNLVEPNGADASGPTSKDLTTSTPPPSTDNNLPTSPAGYSWRLLSSDATQIHCEVEWLAGRFHPLPLSLNNIQTIRQVLATELLADESKADAAGEGGAGDSATLTWEQRGLVLAGLKPASRLYMKCGAWISTRHEQVIFAEKTAANEVILYFTSPPSSEASEGTGTPAPAS
ncbi:hypothetical protein JCM8547_004140 [Rhodosporidiobolus lusitaniae]